MWLLSSDDSCCLSIIKSRAGSSSCTEWLCGTSWRSGEGADCHQLHTEWKWPTLKRKFLRWSGPLWWTMTKSGCIIFLLLHSSMRADTGCFPAHREKHIIRFGRRSEEEMFYRSSFSTEASIFMMNIFVLVYVWHAAQTLAGDFVVYCRFRSYYSWKKIDCKNSSQNSVYCLCKIAILWTISVLLLIYMLVWSCSGRAAEVCCT